MSIDDNKINEQLDLSSFKLLSNNKVRDIYQSDIHPDYLLIKHTNRLSAFDKIWCDVPDKGKILNMTSKWWFEKTSHIIDNHFVKLVNDNDMLVQKCDVYPIEVVVRGYITGTTSTSLWTHYSKGERVYCGIKFRDGLVKNQKLDDIVVTPTTKDVSDDLISKEEIIQRGLMSKNDVDYVFDKAVELFKFGQDISLSKGMILVDTKYEFGFNKKTKKIVLVDEIHTCDSSRYWLSKSYQERFLAGQEPENFDKEVVRRYIVSKCDPYKTDPSEFDIPDDIIFNLSDVYHKFYGMLTSC